MFTTLDPEIEECLKQCELQNSASPMTKQYLKLNILNKRHAKGLSPINTTFTGVKKYELRPDEEVKKQKRREQNRRAAAKCRNKKKWEENLSKANLLKEEGKQRRLRNIISKLTDLKQNIVNLLSDYTHEDRDISSNELYDHSSGRNITQNGTMPTYIEKEVYKRKHIFYNSLNNTPSHANTLNNYQQQMYYPPAFIEAASVNVSNQKYDQSKHSSNFNVIHYFPGSNNLDNSGSFNTYTNIPSISTSSIMFDSQHSLHCYESAGLGTSFDRSDNENFQTSFVNNNTYPGSSFYENSNIKHDVATNINSNIKQDVSTNINSNIDFGASVDISNDISFNALANVNSNIEFNVFPKLNSNINHGTYTNINSNEFTVRNNIINFETVPVNDMPLENIDFNLPKANYCNQNMDKAFYLLPVDGSSVLNEDILYKIMDMYPSQCVQTGYNDLSFT